MPLIYSFVARGNVVLADYTSYTGNFSTVALQVGGAAATAATALASQPRCSPQPTSRPAPGAAARWACAADVPVGPLPPLHLPPHRWPLGPAVCRRWRREGRAPMPSSHTRAMDTVSGRWGKGCMLSSRGLVEGRPGWLTPPPPPLLAAALDRLQHWIGVARCTAAASDSTAASDSKAVCTGVGYCGLHRLSSACSDPVSSPLSSPPPRLLLLCSLQLPFIQWIQ